MAVYFGRGAGSFSDVVTVADGTVTRYALTVGDLNGDGKVDIVVGHVEAPSTVYFNDGSDFAESVLFGDSRNRLRVSIGDFDKDGRRISLSHVRMPQRAVLL